MAGTYGSYNYMLVKVVLFIVTKGLLKFLLSFRVVYRLALIHIKVWRVDYNKPLPE